MDYGFEYEMFPMGSCTDHLIPIWWQYLGSFLRGSRSWRWVFESWIGPQSLPWFPYPLWDEAPPLPISATVLFFLETWGRASPDRTLWDHQQRKSFPFYVVCDKHFLIVMRQSSKSWRENSVSRTATSGFSYDFCIFTTSRSLYTLSGKPIAVLSGLLGSHPV